MIAEPARFGFRRRQQRGIVGGVEDHLGAERGHRPGVRHFPRPEQVAEAQFGAVQAEPLGGHVEELLARHGALEPAGRPVGAARGLVGQHDLDPAPVGGDPVGAGQHGHGQLGHGDAVRAAVGAVVVHDVVAQPGDRPGPVERDRDPVPLLPGMVDRDQVLGPVLGPLDGPPQPGGQPGHQEVLRVELASHAEPPARVDGVHVDHVLGHAEQPGQHVPVEDRDLGHPVDRQRAGRRVDIGQQGAGFQRHGRVPANLDLRLDHGGRAVERRVDVAEAQGEVGRHVARAEQLRGAGRRRGHGVEHRRGLVDVDVHQLGRVLGGVGVLGEHHRQRFAHVPDHVGGQHRLQEVAQDDVLDRQPHRYRQPGGQVRRGDRADHARAASRLGRVHPPDQAVGDRRPDHAGPDLAAHGEVVAEPARAAQHPRVFLARQSRADRVHPASPPGDAAARLALAVASTASTRPW